MRTIKFRVWDKLTNEMEYFVLFERPSVCYAKEIVIMQFTGLLDKNGKEIYEGDIVRCYDTAGEMVYDKEVVFFGFREEIWSKEKDGRTEVEIIGNVYQNPKLLK